MSDYTDLVGYCEKTDYDHVIREVRRDPTLALRRWEGGKTLLHHAAVDGQLELAALLLQLGADVDAEMYMQGTPLHMAVEGDSPEMIRLLLEHNAEINKVDSNGHSVIYKAAVARQHEMIKILLSKEGIVMDEYTSNYISSLKKLGVF